MVYSTTCCTNPENPLLSNACNKMLRTSDTFLVQRVQLKKLAHF
jgi:hypothetical protein